MYTQRLENPHNALWESPWMNSRVSPEDGVRNRLIQPLILQRARPIQRNKTHL